MLKFTSISLGRMQTNHMVALQRYQGFATAQLAQPMQQEQEESLQMSYERAKPYDSIPGPTILQIIARSIPGGKYYGLELSEMNKLLRDEFGSITRFPSTFGRSGFLMVTDPNDFELVFRTEGQWPYRRGLNILNHYRQEVRPERFTEGMTGLPCEHGENWAKMRSIASPILVKPSTVNQYIPPVDDIAIEFVEHMKMLRDTNNELPDTFQYDLNSWALESISYVCFNRRLNLIGNNKDVDAKALSLIQTMEDFFRLTVALDMRPSIWRYVATPKYRQLMACMDRMHDTTSFYIEQAIEEFEKNPTLDPKQESILEKLVKVNKNFATTMASDTMGAGVDTTSSSVAHFMYNLAKNQDKQNKLREELKKVPTDGNGKLMPSSFDKVPYLRACIKESFRKSPIILGNSRGAGRDIVIKGHQVPKGTNIIMANSMAQQENAHFKDADKFLPERWLSEKMPDACPEKNASNPFTYMPFGFGTRSCVGKRIAEMEMNCFITRLLQRFRIEFDYGPLKNKNALILSPKDPLKFKLFEV